MRHTICSMFALLVPLLAGCGEAPASPERVAEALHQIVAAQARYHQQDPHGATAYAPSFEELAALLDDPALKAGGLPGYDLRLAAEAGGRWSLHATPHEPDQPSFFVDAWGFVRRSETGPADRSTALETPALSIDPKSLRDSPAARDLREISAHQKLFTMVGGGAQGFARSLAELRTAGEVPLSADDYAYVIEAPQHEVAWTAWAVPLRAGLPLLFVDQTGVLRYESERAPGPRSPTLP